MRILLFYGHPTLFLPYLRSLGEVPGMKVAAMFRPQDSRTARKSRHLCRRYEVRTENDDDAELRALEAASRDFHPDVILPVCDRAHELLSRHQERLAALPCRLLPAVPEQTLLDARDKRRLSLVLRRHGLPHPQTFQLQEFVESQPETLPEGPWLLKAANLNGGRGITRFETTAELLAHLASARPDPAEHVVQQWIGGEVVNCNVLCQAGRILAHTTHRSLETANGFTPHYELEFGEVPGVLPAVADLMAALGWNGVANLDLLRERKTGRVLILEVNARSWSSLLGSTAAGVNFPWLAARLALGETFESPQKRSLRFKLRLDAARQLAVSWLRFRRPRFAFRETDLPFTVRDPGPELYGLARQLWRRFR